VAPGCGGGSKGDGRTTVAAAFYPLAFAAEQIGGSRVSVRNLTPPGAEPHDIELSPRDVEHIRSADVVLYLGSGFQPSFERAAQDAGGKKLELLRDSGVLAMGDEVDPHIWLDPMRYARVGRRIGQVLNRSQAAIVFGSRLRRLDAELQRGLADCDRREIVTSHAAFGYFADRYDLEEVPLVGLAPESEPSARDLERLVRKVEDHHATTVFFEPLVSPRLARTVARESGAETAVLNPIEGLSEEELAAGQGYFSLMRHNLRALRSALGCR
jgi:zinc transport system substrate-binding protein